MAGHFFGPLLGAVQHAQDANLVASDQIGGNIWCAVNDQFPCALNAARTPNPWRLTQSLDSGFNAAINRISGTWTFGLDVIEDSDPVGK
jgi:hypothetical protein